MQRRVRFDDLPPVVRARFVACAKGKAEPPPLAFEPRRSHAVLLAAVALAAGAVLLGLFVFGFGLEEGRWTTTTAIYGGAVLVIALPVALAAADRARRRSLPWAPGRYLFPACVVDASRAELRVLPLTSLRRARSIAMGPRAAPYPGRLRRLIALRRSWLELEFEGGHVETFVEDACEPLDPKDLERMATKLARLGELGKDQALARFDPLLPSSADVGHEVVGGYRSRTEPVVADAPVTRPPRGWQSRPVSTALAATLAGAALLGGWALPSLAIVRARARHDPAALSRVARAWPFGWVAREAGVVVKDADGAFADLARRIGEPGGPRALALRDLLRDAEAKGDARLPVYVSFAKPSLELSRLILHDDQRRRVAVALQRALALPEELITPTYAGASLPGSRCVIEGSDAACLAIECVASANGHTYAVHGRDVVGFDLRCDAALLRGGQRTRLVVATATPSDELDLAVLGDPPASDDETSESEPPLPDGDGSDAGPAVPIEDAATVLLLNGAIDGLPLAFEHALADKAP